MKFTKISSRNPSLCAPFANFVGKRVSNSPCDKFLQYDFVPFRGMAFGNPFWYAVNKARLYELVEVHAYFSLADCPAFTNDFAHFVIVGFIK